ncbi:MAG: hypothetical protein GAK37_03159 [Pseudomonas sp.]|nr:MAG: hypothetical protein GAK37_03159 [Pseudomonas sp.]
MPALTTDRHTPHQDAGIIGVPVAAGVQIFAGSLVAASASGYATPGAPSAALTYIGRAEEYADNRAGPDGGALVRVRRLRAFMWANDGSITQAHLMKQAFIVDDQTVAAEDGGTRPPAGRIIGIEAGGVWVE